jgi:four helix bundle protein
MAFKDFRDLIAYQKGFALSMEIYELTKAFPTEERYSLTDQIRRSSRSTCAAIAEAYRKRNYPAHLVSKRIDADTENAETQNWLLFAQACQYISAEKAAALMAQSREIGKLLAFMMDNPTKFRYQ